MNYIQVSWASQNTSHNSLKWSSYIKEQYKYFFQLWIKPEFGHSAWALKAEQGGL